MPRDGQKPTALPIDAFGDGGFRIAGDRHEGHVLILGVQVSEWSVGADAKALGVADLGRVLKGADAPDMLVLGTGKRLAHPPAAVRQAFREAGVGLEVLDTATACRTYNLLAGEGRRIRAALIAI
jgi:uncharacterized protein